MVDDFHQIDLKPNVVKGHLLCWGQYPAVAVHNNRVVITHDYPYLLYTTYCHIGNIDVDNIVLRWTTDHEKLFESKFVSETSITINDQHIVLTGRGMTSILC